jgi:hypothetical protein
MICQCFFAKRIQLAPCDISVKLPVPRRRIKLGEPISEARQVFGRQLRNRPFYFGGAHANILRDARTVSIEFR